MLNLKEVPKLKLQYNCRNTKPIGLTNSLLTHFPAAKILKQDGENVDYIVYEGDKDFSEKMASLVKRYKLNSVDLDDITILSPVKYDESKVNKTSALTRVCNINTVGNSDKNGVTFFTIQGFKGLESKIVLLTDIERIIPDYFNSLLYTAISRAKVQLHIFCSTEMKRDLDKRYIDGVIKLKN